jgi:hypothetical protein
MPLEQNPLSGIVRPGGAPSPSDGSGLLPQATSPNPSMPPQGAGGPQPQGGQGQPNQLGAIMAALQQAPQMPQGQPSPSHEQTSAALWHLHEVQRYMGALLARPGVGTTNMRPAIFDAVSKMLADGLFTLPQLMNELKSLPADPKGQKQWIVQHLTHARQAQLQILNDHRQTAQGTGDWASEQAANPPSGREHLDIMNDLRSHYQQMGRQ